MTECEIMERLRAAVRDAGSQSAFATAHGLTVQYVNDVLRGRRCISDRIARAVGVRRVVVFEEVTE